jgi:hypothetical protein
MAKDSIVQNGAPMNRWGLERRLEFIDFRLLWEGRVNRSDLTSYFGISVPQASADFARYQELAPSNMVYDKQLRTYVSEPSFQPVIEALNAYSFLNAIRQVDGQMLAKSSTFLGWIPPYWIVRTPNRHVDIAILRSSLQAIRTNTRLKIDYQSRHRPSPTQRSISPHAIGFDGVRWHLRAFCYEHEDFRDFVISRVTAAETSLELGIDPSGDSSWHAELSVVIAPAPHLPIGERKAVELDYAMIDGRLELRVREAMLLYLLVQLPLYRDAGRTPHNPLVLVNLSELQAVLEKLQIEI